MPLPRHRPRRVRLAAVAVAACAAAALALPTSATGAATRERIWERGKVVSHSDGDTPYVDLAGNGRKDKSPIRLIGVNATETRHKLHGSWQGKDWCHGQAAKRRAEQLMPVGARVMMRSLHRSSYNGERRQRTVHVYRNGTWLNVQRTLLSEGHVVWFPHPDEWKHNAEYHRLAVAAMSSGRNIWDKTHCGDGPQQGADLRVFVHYDGNGADDQDNAHRNDEYVIVANEGSGAVDLSGWYVRDSSTRMFRFPNGTNLPSGSELQVHTGRGSNTARDLYWGLGQSLFGEPHKAAGMGDAAYLLDPDGDFRAWSMYPCIVNCNDSRRGVVVIQSVRYDIPGGDTNKEQVVLRNTGSNTVSLGHLQLRSWPYNYVFPAGFTLGGGDTVTVHIRNSNNHPQQTGTDRYWVGSSTSILNDTTDAVDLSTLDEIRIDCKRWNNGNGAGETCYNS